jgi:hypothetical protein
MNCGKILIDSELVMKFIANQKLLPNVLQSETFMQVPANQKRKQNFHQAGTGIMYRDSPTCQKFSASQELR